MIEFLSGAIMTGFAIAALFFVRFWVRTKDPLFAGFAVAFGMLSLERWVLFLTLSGQDESQASIYLIRATAFIIIIVTVVLKNRSAVAERH